MGVSQQEHGAPSPLAVLSPFKSSFFVDNGPTWMRRLLLSRQYPTTPPRAYAVCSYEYAMNSHGLLTEAIDVEPAIGFAHALYAHVRLSVGGLFILKKKGNNRLISLGQAYLSTGTIVSKSSTLTLTFNRLQSSRPTCVRLDGRAEQARTNEKHMN